MSDRRCYSCCKSGHSIRHSPKKKGNQKENVRSELNVAIMSSYEVGYKPNYRFCICVKSYLNEWFPDSVHCSMLHFHYFDECFYINFHITKCHVCMHSGWDYYCEDTGCVLTLIGALTVCMPTSNMEYRWLKHLDHEKWCD